MTAITSLPEILVRAGGHLLGDWERGSLAGVRVQRKLSVPSLVELTFADPPEELDLMGRLAPSTPLRVEAAGGATPLFDGRATAVQYQHEADRGLTVRVRGYDALHRLRRRQQVRTWTDVTVEDVARELAAPVGLRVRASAPGPRWPQVTQHVQSDLELLQELTARAGLYFTVDGDVLRLLTLEGDGREVELEVGTDLWELRGEVNIDRVARRVTAVGWDPGRFEVHRAEAGRARTARAAAATGAGAAGGGEAGDRLLPHVGASTRDLSTAEAQAELDARDAAGLVVWGVAEGNALLGPGTPVLVRGSVPPFDGRHVVTAVTHTVGASGFFTEFETDAPPDRRPDRSLVLSPGVVTDVGDPDRLGRVKVKLPTYDDATTAWLQVVLPAAGHDKGLVALPDVDDRVVVLHPYGDPARGVVAGAVYGPDAPPDSGVERGAVRRYTLTTRGGQEVVLDDMEDGRVRVANASGSFVEMGAEEFRLHAATDLVIEAPGRGITIVGDAIDFRRG